VTRSRTWRSGTPARSSGFLDEAEEIIADGDEGGLFLVALGVLALEQQRDELRERLRAAGLPPD
jgi:hypothetical protein